MCCRNVGKTHFIGKLRMNFYRTYQKSWTAFKIKLANGKVISDENRSQNLVNNFTF